MGMRLWYWQQALSLSVRFLHERFRFRRTSRPSGVEAPLIAHSGGSGTLFQDVPYAIRNLVKSPGFSGVAVLTLALGIGANTAIFSVVDGILLSPLPLSEPDRIVALCETNPAIADFCIGSPPNVEDWDDQATAIEDFGLGRQWSFVVRGDDGAEGIGGGLATPGMFEVLRLTPALGRLLQRHDLEPANNHVAVLSHALWQTRFGADPSVIGRPILLDGESYQIVGVLAAGVEVPRLEDVELWVPLHFHPREERRRSWRGFMVYGRLSDEATLAGAREEMRVIADRLAVAYPETNDGWGIEVMPLRDRIVGSVRPTLLVFLAAVGFVLLIGCANVANLLLVRGASRRRELAVRSAMGAGRRRLVRLLLSEALVLSVLGGIGGVALSLLAVNAFISLAPQGIPRLDEVAVDSRVLTFAMLLSVVTAVVFGLLPALNASAVDLNQALKEGDPRAAGRSRLGAKGILVISEVALALMLLIGAGLLTRSFTGLLDWDPGFDRENLLTVWLFTASPRFQTGLQVVELHSRAAEEVASLPSVISVGKTSAGPLFGGLETDEFTIGGRPEPEPGERPVARWYDVGPNYFATLGLPMLAGRSFTDDDVRESPRVAVINKALADRYWPDEDPLGGQISMYGMTMTVVGIVENVTPFRPGEATRPEVYWPQNQSPRLATFLLIRTAADHATLIRPIRERLKALDPDMRVARFTTMESHIDRQLVRPKFNMLLVGIFAAVALALASIGIYGVVSYSVAMRTREMGIRMALGARRIDVMRSVIGRGMVPAVVGIGIGLVGAFGVTQLLTSMLVGVEPTDSVTFFSVPVLLAFVAAFACYVPATRATRVEASTTLREE
jgi:putative ABC transport system permease protein